RLVARFRVVVGRAAPHHRDLDGDPALVARVVEQPQPPGPVDLALARVAELQIAWVASPHVADVGVHRVGPEDLRDAAQIVAEGERVADVDVDLERWKPDRGEQLERVAWPLRGGAPMRLERHRHPLLASVLGDDVGVAPHLGPDLLPVPVGRGGPRADRDERGAEPRGDVDGPPEPAQPLLLLGDARRDESEQSAHCRRDQPVPVVERQDLVDAAVVERVDRGRVVVARRELGAPVADRGDVRQRLLDRQLAVAVRPTAEPHRGLRHYTERQEETMAATVAVIGPLFDDLKQLEARGVRAIQAQGGSEQNIVESCADADVIMCFGLSPFTDRVFASLPKLKLVQQCTVGYDWIDVDAATRHGVAVANSPFFCTEEVSDHAVMHIMACARKLSQQLWAAREHGWNRQAAVEQMGEIFRLRGRTLGFVAFGRIARLTAQKMSGFGMTYIAYDPYLKPEQVKDANVELVSLDELCRRSDVVSMHALLNESTRGMFGEAQFRAMKPTAYFVNTSRGGTVDEAALIRALREGWIAGAGLDVLVTE